MDSLVSFGTFTEDDSFVEDDTRAWSDSFCVHVTFLADDSFL